MKTMRVPFTLSDWKLLPEAFPAHLIDGCLVREAAPTYGHQNLVGRVHVHLVALLGHARVVLSPADVVIDRLNVLQPDVCVLRTIPPRDSHDVGIPLVAFEILSPSTRRHDRTIKATKFLAAGVEELWLLDPAHRTIEIRTTRGPTVVRGGAEARSTALPGFALVPDDLCADE